MSELLVLTVIAIVLVVTLQQKLLPRYQQHHPGYVYFIQPRHNPSRIKIGYTKRNPHKRLRQLQTGSSEVLILRGYVVGSRDDEQRLHEEFASDRLHGEWFQLTPGIERYISRSRVLNS